MARRPLEALAGVLTTEQADGLRAAAADNAAALSGRCGRPAFR